MDINEQIVFLAAKFCWPDLSDASIMMRLNDYASKVELLYDLQAIITESDEFQQGQQESQGV